MGIDAQSVDSRPACILPLVKKIAMGPSVVTDFRVTAHSSATLAVARARLVRSLANLLKIAADPLRILMLASL